MSLIKTIFHAPNFRARLIRRHLLIRNEVYRGARPRFVGRRRLRGPGFIGRPCASSLLPFSGRVLEAVTAGSPADRLMRGLIEELVTRDCLPKLGAEVMPET